MSDQEVQSNVISIVTRKPIDHFVQPSLEELEEAASEERKQIIAAQLEGLDAMRKLIETGMIGTIVVCGQMTDDPTTFYNDVIFGAPLMPNDAIPFVGALDLLKHEMAELAYTADVIMRDGTIQQPEMIDDEDFDDD